MFRFPWGDMHSLNLGWFLQKFNELREDWATAEAGIDGALDAEIQKAEDALSDVFDARDAAAASATAAAGSASAANTSKTAAQNSATAAASSATLANQKATAAGLSEAAAAQSATAASNSATAAAGSATQAGQSATNAAASETAAGQSASAAAASAASIEGDAAAAAASATQAGNSETAAAASAAAAQSAAGSGLYNDIAFPTMYYNNNELSKGTVTGASNLTGFIAGMAAHLERTAGEEQYVIIPSRGPAAIQNGSPIASDVLPNKALPAGQYTINIIANYKPSGTENTFYVRIYRYRSNSFSSVVNRQIYIPGYNKYVHGVTLEEGDLIIPGIISAPSTMSAKVDLIIEITPMQSLTLGSIRNDEINELSEITPEEKTL